MSFEVPERLKKIRVSKNLKLKPTPHLKTTFTGYDGKEYPLKIRYYQVQGILHLIVMARFVLGDDTGLGKTLEAIAALCYVWEKDPDRKVIGLTTKSATPQWANEFKKFTTGVKVIVCQGTPKKREKAREAFLAAKGPTVMIGGYRSFVRDITAIQEWEGYILVADEATAFKNPKTQVHQVVRHMGFQAARVWALTATLIKNNLMEGYGIYQVVKPDLFGMTANRFMLYYCLVEMIPIPRSNRKVPKIVGYAPDKVREFRDRIEPVYLGRPKHEVASDLPVLEMKQVQVGLSPAQQEKYDEALGGLLTVGTGVIDDVTGEEV
ncbi:MAG: SNF2-related protein, partial [Planctomycetota bacterium]